LLMKITHAQVIIHGGHDFLDPLLILATFSRGHRYERSTLSISW
jgi:hypothetical protein